MKSNATARTSKGSKRSRKPSSKATKPKKRAKNAAPDRSDRNNSEQIQGATGPGDAPLACEDGYPFTDKQLKYLLAWREAALEGRPISDSAIAEVIGISRTTIWTWNHDPGFMAWVRREVSLPHDSEFDLAVARHTRLAIRGSVRSFEAICRLRSVGVKGGGFTDSAENVDQSVTNYSVILLSPRPPAMPAPEPKQVGGGQA